MSINNHHSNIDLNSFSAVNIRTNLNKSRTGVRLEQLKTLNDRPVTSGFLASATRCTDGPQSTYSRKIGSRAIPSIQIKATRPLSTSMNASKQNRLSYRKKMAYLIKQGPSNSNYGSRPKTCKKANGAYNL